ncbi:MAG: hypothetical protein KC503_16795, partial [Myxococcales bacterium]|nr:hypothetical protein [Myxococcales bacterium]
MDMLLKTNFVPVAPEGYFDRLWPSVEQRLDDDPEGAATTAGGSKDAESKAKGAAKAASADDGEVVFHSSAALKVLNIPDKRPKEPEPRRAAPAAASAPSAPVPQPEPQKQAGYAWPIAFVLAAGIVTGGFLYYKKQNEKKNAANATLAAGQRTGTIGAPAGEGSAAGTA